ncbi:NHR domain-containing protein [Durusdinium trenchii]|uniref:NHR domain-containing protein n=1 Tax=Durusdinium trenchii TaxID=1381693 RepID=A0ABP0MJS0_9DINO
MDLEAVIPSSILADASADGPRALFAAGSDGRVWRAWLPEETPITRGRDDSFVQLVAHAIAEASVCAELLSPVVELELCTLTSRLLVSTFERIAVIGDALAAEVSTVCWVGSKPHKGRLTATFGRFFGADAIIAPRPGGRLWVADGSGTVQQPGLAIA